MGAGSVVHAKQTVLDFSGQVHREHGWHKNRPGWPESEPPCAEHRWFLKIFKVLLDLN